MATDTQSAQVGDIGTLIRVTVVDATGAAVDLSAATILRIILGKPSGSAVEVEASLLTDGTDGKMGYYTQEGVLDEPGTWRVQAYYELPAGKWRTEVEKFRVRANIS